MFGDSALVIGGEPNRYTEVVLSMFQQACQSQLSKSDCDIVDYLNELREGCLEADTVIIQVSKGTAYPEVLLMQTRVQFRLSFFDLIARFEGHTESIGTGAANLIGNLYTGCGKDVLKLIAARVMIFEVLAKG